MDKKRKIIKKKVSWVEKISYSVLVVLLLILIYMLTLKIIGKSPTFLDLLLVLVVGLIVNTFKMEFKFGKFNQFVEGTFPQFRESVRDSFIRMKEDMGELKEKINKTQENMNKTQENISLIKEKLKI